MERCAGRRSQSPHQRFHARHGLHDHMDGRRLEVVADGLPFHGGAQLARTYFGHDQLWPGRLRPRPGRLWPEPGRLWQQRLTWPIWADSGQPCPPALAWPIWVRTALRRTALRRALRRTALRRTALHRTALRRTSVPLCICTSALLLRIIRPELAATLGKKGRSSRNARSARPAKATARTRTVDEIRLLEA